MGNASHVVMVTGGNRGIGLATCSALAKRGAHVVMTARDSVRGLASAAELRALYPSAEIDVMTLDLASLASVRRFAAAFLERGLLLHALINNAGAIGLTGPIQFTDDGFELEFGINHLGHFLLTELLLPALKVSAPARVIAVSSIRHIPGRGGKGARFDFDNLKGEKGYDPRLVYNNTKLANVWFAYELNRRMAGSGVIALAACPGFVPQTLGVTKQGLARWFYDKVLMLIPSARTADVAGRELAELALSPRYADAGGRFFADGRAIRSSDASCDEAQARRLWDLSVQLTRSDETGA